ncbi:hypothetical protein LOZ65_006811 [Ophidiomyces ophidiicola]|nr:hypothetical protein LOZ65_006811 [Ophidiomyces ophidiicola]
MPVVIDTAMRTPGYPDEAYFFKDTRYLRMWWKPGTPEERKIFGPATISQEWKVVREAGFTRIDAMLPSTRDPQKYYAFSGSRYVRGSFVPGTPTESKLFGPANIVDEWKTLRDAGFDCVDAVLPIRSTDPAAGFEEEAYFFCGTRYLRMRWTPQTPREELLFGPAPIAAEWKTLRDAGFETVDALVPNLEAARPGEVDVYAFSGPRYVRFSFEPGTPKETKIYGVAEIDDEWKTLREL